MLAVLLQSFITKKYPKKKHHVSVYQDSIIKINKKYYLQTFLQECKYVQEKIKTENNIDEDLEKSDTNDETKSDIDNDE